VLTGIVDAQLRFVPSLARTRPRTLPPDLRVDRAGAALAAENGGFRLSF
jgi:hypothetical protein